MECREQVSTHVSLQNLYCCMPYNSWRRLRLFVCIFNYNVENEISIDKPLNEKKCPSTCIVMNMFLLFITPHVIFPMTIILDFISYFPFEINVSVAFIMITSWKPGLWVTLTHKSNKSLGTHQLQRLKVLLSWPKTF